jgi:replicative DNA helicase
VALELVRTAVKTGARALVVSREMTTSSLARRLMAQDARVASSTLKRGDLSIEEWKSFGEAREWLQGTSLWLTDQMVSLEQLNGYLAHTQFDLVVVDYLQLMRAPASIKERRHQVEYVSHGLKSLALAHQVPVVCLSSLSRPAVGRDGKEPKPTMASLRESGELEHDADVILLLHRQRDDPNAICLIEKNRDGRLGRIKLIFDGQFVSFKEDPDQTFVEDY